MKTCVHIVELNHIIKATTLTVIESRQIIERQIREIAENDL